MNRIRGLLFDLDGTIADSIGFFCDLASEMLAGAQLAAPERSAVLESIAFGIPPVKRFLPDDFPGREAYLERLYRENWPKWLERYGLETEPVPGACESICRLHESGLRLGLVTSSSGTLPFLERWGIRRCFTTVVCRDDVREIKPHPEGLLASLDRLGLDPDHALHVGDTPIDVRAGHAAGLHTIGVLTGAGTEEQLRAEGVAAILPSVASLPSFLETDGRW